MTRDQPLRFGRTADVLTAATLSAACGRAVALLDADGRVICLTSRRTPGSPPADDQP